MSPPLQDEPAPAGPSAVSSGFTEAAERIAAAVGQAPGVAGLSGGRLGGVGTYLPGRRVTGVVIRDGELEVHVIGRYGTPVPEIASAVRRAAEPFAGDRTVHVIIEDLA
jgi:hypothetical protein